MLIVLKKKMEKRIPQIRPVFRYLAGIIACLAGVGVIIALFNFSNYPQKLSSYGFLLGQIWLCILMAYASIKGKVPNWLVNQK
jgi:hypothetical protein